MIFELNDYEFIQLNSLLKILQLVETGGEANVCIVGGAVKVNGEKELQKRKKIRAGDLIEFDGKKINVIQHA